MGGSDSGPTPETKAPLPLNGHTLESTALSVFASSSWAVCSPALRRFRPRPRVAWPRMKAKMKALLGKDKKPGTVRGLTIRGAAFPPPREEAEGGGGTGAPPAGPGGVAAPVGAGRPAGGAGAPGGPRAPAALAGDVAESYGSGAPAVSSSALLRSAPVEGGAGAGAGIDAAGSLPAGGGGGVGGGGSGGGSGSEKSDGLLDKEARVPAVRRPSYCTPGVPDDATASATRVGRFQRVLEARVIDLDALRQLSWSGVPRQFRMQVWQLLLVRMVC